MHPPPCPPNDLHYNDPRVGHVHDDSIDAPHLRTFFFQSTSDLRSDEHRTSTSSGKFLYRNSFSARSRAETGSSATSASEPSSSFSPPSSPPSSLAVLDHDDADAIALSPMSPCKYTHRIYTPQGNEGDDDHDDPDAVNHFYGGTRTDADVDLGSQRPPVVRSPHLSTRGLLLQKDTALPHETDGLLSRSPSRAQSLGSINTPSPATCRNGADASLMQEKFEMAFTRVEMGVHAFGVGVVVLLIILSVWLTLANIIM